MPTLKEMIWPIVLITIASAIVILAIAPLDGSAWAEGMRAGASAEGGEALDQLSGIIRFIGPLIKITLLMGVPGLITLGVRRAVRRVRKLSA